MIALPLPTDSNRGCSIRPVLARLFPASVSRTSWGDGPVHAGLLLESSHKPREDSRTGRTYEASKGGVRSGFGLLNCGFTAESGVSGINDETWVY